jgi:hypothetical protein
MLISLRTKPPVKPTRNRPGGQEPGAGRGKNNRDWRHEQ